ncbi:helix-turn-helix transcriptional regulator [Kutzneria buriramensis]|uniref:Helix-turn-helix protein n=1 Tax=Kutzneria buriramensis TaxID=1045776 RepID=A0A3E0G857_9PSEU|nr:helix-turn-helix transcriptional regulator [Kutzneria buriramensis]REH18254.1 helix-turn-helix protein [Kutzneria buriramensis]
MPVLQKTPAGRHVDEIVAFNNEFSRIVTDASGSRLTVQRANQLMPWEFYGDNLDSVDVPAADVRRMRARYLDLTEPEPTAGVPTPASELQATTVTEFVQLLHTLRARANLRGVKLAERAGLPVSQLYSMTDVGRGKLPTKIEQVRDLVTACGLSPDQVARVVRLWEEIRNPSSSSAIMIDPAVWSPALPELEKIRGITFKIPAGTALPTQTLLNVMRHAPGHPFDAATRRAVLRWVEQQPKGTRLTVGTTRDQVQALVANAMELLNEAMELSKMADEDDSDVVALLPQEHHETAAAAG